MLFDVFKLLFVVHSEVSNVDVTVVLCGTCDVALSTRIVKSERGGHHGVQWHAGS